MLTSNGYRLDMSPHRWGELTDSTAAAGRRDHGELWQRLRADGYLLLRDFLDRQTVLAFRRYFFGALAPTGLLAAGSDPADGIARTDAGTDGGTDAGTDRALLRSTLFGSVVPGAEYQRLCTDPRITGFFGWLLGTPDAHAAVHLHRRRILRHTRPGERGVGVATQAHYDLLYLREGTDRVLSMWIPLGDCPAERGGLVYLERSHLWVLRDEAAGQLRPAASITADLPSLADAHDARWLGAEFRAGDVMIHSAHIVHAATDNVDPGGVMRLSTDIRYQRSSEPIDWRWQQHWHDRDGL
ncbi:phytanoyl-CoA dioxygenase family protein [Nakamurella aerolata]|uniref:Phytanoyl-CoA dioxygenase n=1 Tax=Nakamurella aerolata TaxID=1656892 RepID=A0A849A4N7_9ACTN|nr:phytanoyl-CoA dioxygenase family protein [Nakamurella aerolata]NNG35539.1 phytanoyl-CoA dioxygenase [Nakamurella aerolata]